jgi:TM2 domain-containing membrane protein YozV
MKLLDQKVKKIMTKKSGKSKMTAALLAIFLGSFGLHKFYLGQVTWGLLYLFLFWSSISMILGFIEGIYYLTMSDKDFENKYS